jgi:peptidoglycan/LPS O-acetylase OafA/YrhL
VVLWPSGADRHLNGFDQAAAADAGIVVKTPPEPAVGRASGSLGRNADLDGLRGIAALSVALGHCFEQVTGIPLWLTSFKNFHTMPTADIVARVLSAFFPSDAAVMVFFALSGHVLWGSYRRKNLRFFRDLPEYTASRLYRLLPLTIVSAIPIAFLAEVPGRALVRNMLLLSYDVNGVLWSLQAEMVASAVLFLLWGATKGSTWKMLVGLLLAFAVIPFSRGSVQIVFLPAFILGACISSVPAWFFRNVWVLTAGILVLLFTNVFLGHGGIDRCVEMGAATVLVGAVHHGRLPFLHWRIPLFLGAISYPFYLTHVVGLMLAQPFLDMLHFNSPYPMIAMRALTSIPPVLLIAWLLHVLVEVPIQRARPSIAWPFTINWTARLRPMVRRPLQADVPAVATADTIGSSQTPV